MYTAHKHLLILISLLKQHGVSHLVLSPGARSVPFVRTVELDKDFTCYSVVDERSAAFFALGLAKEIKKPVGIACTSSTATCNYYSAIVEAYYQQTPIVVLTFDRDPYLLEQMENQMINQNGMYGQYCRKSVTLPYVTTIRDEVYCERLVNDALLELSHRGFGPVQINIPIYSADLFNVQELPVARKITRVVMGIDENEWIKKREYLKDKTILFIFGMSNKLSAEEDAQLKDFWEKHNCAIVGEHMSNLNKSYGLSSYTFAEVVSENMFSKYLPDVVITYGGNISGRLKDLFRNRPKTVEHWSIREDGGLVDVFKNLTTVFESSLSYFLNFFNLVKYNTSANKDYYYKWKFAIESIQVNDIEFSNFYVAKALINKMQENAIYHTGILNSTRHSNYFPLKDGVEYYSNIGAYGIDGTMSTFIGQSMATDKRCYLLIGDLSFFYDMNSLSIRGIKNNVRIIVVNNGGGGEFHYVMGKERIPTIDRHISAGHNHSVRGWVESLGFLYLSANDKKTFDQNLVDFINIESDVPVVFEVFTDMESDASITKKFIINNLIEDPVDKIKRESMDLGKKVLHSWQRSKMNKEKN